MREPHAFATFACPHSGACALTRGSSPRWSAVREEALKQKQLARAEAQEARGHAITREKAERERAVEMAIKRYENAKGRAVAQKAVTSIMDSAEAHKKQIEALASVRVEQAVAQAEERGRKMQKQAVALAVKEAVEKRKEAEAKALAQAGIAAVEAAKRDIEGEKRAALVEQVCVEQSVFGSRDASAL